MLIIKPIKGQPSYYVTNEGEVLSTKKGDCRVLSPGKDSGGYYTVSLCQKGKGKTHRLHRLLAESFIANPESKGDVNHMDGDKSNNDISNLEWNTRKENLAHAFRTGLRTMPSGDAWHSGNRR
jgi:hypothetical protein